MSAIFRNLTNPDSWPAFARGLLAYGSAEAVTRVVRLGAILVVARQISPTMLGTAAFALSLFELVRVLTNVGIGQRIIIARDDELGAICSTALRLFWIVCFSVLLIQLCVAAFTWSVFGQAEVAAMLAALALVYLFMPAGLVQIFLAMRAQWMGTTARVAAIQNIADSALTVALVLVWPSVWAIVLPKLLTAPLWLVLARRAYPSYPKVEGAAAPVAAFNRFGPSILATEMLGAARLHGDKLLVGALLGTEALGIYFFAFNVGLGITQAFVAACNLVLFPHLARAHSHRIETEFWTAFLIGLALLTPVVLAQVVFAPIYVPIVFGDNWIASIPYVSLLAVAAFPLYAGSLLGARYRALGRPMAETILMAGATVTALVGLFVGAQFNLTYACLGFGAGLAVVLLPAVIIRLNSLRPIFSSPIQGET